MKGSWYNSFVNAELAEIGLNVLHSTYSPYGKGTDSYAPIIALGESWAYHMGEFMADMRYGNALSTRAVELGINYYNGFPVSMLSSHINLLEDYSPFRTADPFYWIPKGVFEDLIDTRNDNATSTTAVNDQVSGYTNSQLFSIFNSNILTLQAYRNSVINNIANTTSGNVVNLFGQYGY